MFGKNLTGYYRLLKQAPSLAIAEDGWTLLQVAVLNQLPPFIEHIISVNSSCLNVPSGEYGFRCAKYLTNRGEPFYFVQGATALHFACLIGNLEIADMLLKAGADWTIKDSTSRTAEDYVRNAHGLIYTNIFKRLCEEENVRRKAKTVSTDSPAPATPSPASSGQDNTTASPKKDDPPKDIPKAEEKPNKTPGSSGSSTPRSESSERSDTESDKPDKKAKKEDASSPARGKISFLARFKI